MSDALTDVGEITASKVEAFKSAESYGEIERPDKSCSSKSPSPPRASPLGGFDVNPFDFYVRGDDGTHYDYGEGNTLGISGDDDLNGTTLTKGEKLAGKLVFDVPSRHARLRTRFGALYEWAFDPS